MKHRVESLHDHKAHVATIAEWHWREWGHADPEGSLAAWTAALHTRLNVETIPAAFVALDRSNEPTGTIVLVESDMSTHPELGPWIAGLFVIPSHRRRGLGSALMKHATDAATQMGHPDLFLHTSTATCLYLQLGWKKLFRESYEGEIVDVMHYATEIQR
jgi:predicted N-acetyltransferase YhbS